MSVTEALNFPDWLILLDFYQDTLEAAENELREQQALERELHSRR